MYCNKNLNTVQISNIIGCSDSAVGRILKNNNIQRIHTPNEINLSNQQIKEICNQYIEGKTTVEISALYNICDNSVTKVLRENNIKIRPAKRYSNVKKHDYFNKIDTIDKAYFLGWMISDGAIIESKTRKNRSNVISLEIHNKDRIILEMFSKALGAEDNIIKLFPKRNHANIRFASEQMSKDLSKYGAVPRKSQITYLPLIRDDLMSHLIRGIFDGDGTITIDKNGNGHLCFYGSEKICNQIADYLHNKVGLNRNKVSKSTCYHVWYGGKKPIKIMKDFLYKDCGEFYLERKYLKFQEVA